MQDRYGLVPATIRHNYEREEMVDRHIGSATTLYQALHAYDPRLDVVFIADRADREYGVVPGRWHVVRKNEGQPDSYMPIQGPDGEYIEPHMGIYHELQQRDLWKHGLPEPEKKPAAFSEDNDPDRENRVEELAFNLRAGQRVAGDGGLTKRKWGKK